MASGLHHGPVYPIYPMKLSEKYLKEHLERKPPFLPTKTPMKEERYALYTSLVMLAILGIGVLGFVLN